MSTSRKARTAAADLAEKADTAAPADKLFSSIDGTDVRVTHGDGSVAIVGETPRTLPRKLWRAAIKAGCQTNTSLRAADMPVDPADDAFTRKQAIKDAMIAALQADDTDPAFEDAFTANDIPNVRWLEKRVGFSLSGDERDVCWSEVQANLPDEEEEDEGDGE